MSATHAAIAYASTRRQSELSGAIASRLLIGQTRGILMERYDLDPGQAFDVLVPHEQH